MDEIKFQVSNGCKNIIGFKWVQKGFWFQNVIKKRYVSNVCKKIFQVSNECKKNLGVKWE